MKHALYCVVILAVLWPAAIADGSVVYLNDGSELTGDVTRKDNYIIVKTNDGKTTRISNDKILYNSDDQARQDEDSPPAESAEKSDQVKPPAITKTNITFNPAQAIRPESIVFMLLRKRIAELNRAGNAIEGQIKQYRMMVHDKRRKIGHDWVKPDYFTRKRRAAMAAVNQAKAALDKADSLHKQKNNTEKTRLEKTALTANRKAVAAWADPLLRVFLLAGYEMAVNNKNRALALYGKCLRQRPTVAAFYQGYIDALLALDRYDDALKTSLALLDLRPDSKDALDVVKKTLAACPGKMVENETFKQVREILKKAAEKAKSKKLRRKRQDSDDKTVWLLPGEDVIVKPGRLPIPPMDRLDFQQAVAAAIAPNALLADKSVVADALELFIILDDGKAIPVKCDKRSLKNTQSPIAVLIVQGYEFTQPAKLADLPAAGQPVKVYSVNMFEEMGSAIRTMSMQVQDNASAERLGGGGLFPGETSAPVFNDKGQLVGFMLGKIKPLDDDMPDIFLGRSELEEKLKKSLRRLRRKQSKSADNAAAKPIDGKVFRLQVIHGERFD